MVEAKRIGKIGPPRNIDNENLMVRVLNCTDNPKLVLFSIRGKDGMDPDEYAHEI
jgi:hypothetical protein